jgi:hypothetical protein
VPKARRAQSGYSMPLKWVRGRNATAGQGHGNMNVHGNTGNTAGSVTFPPPPGPAAGGGGDAFGYSGNGAATGAGGRAATPIAAVPGKRAGGTIDSHHPETLEAVIEHAEARKRRFAERAARAEADRDHLVANGGSDEDLQAAEARRTAAIAAVVALMGQLKVLRRVLAEYHAWLEEDAGMAGAAAVGRATAATAAMTSAVDATAASTTVFNMPGAPQGSGPRRSENPRRAVAASTPSARHPGCR